MTNIMINLPGGTFRHKALKPMIARVAAIGPLRLRSHNTPDEIRADLGWCDAILMWSWPTLNEDLLQHAPKLRFVGSIDIGRQAGEALLTRGVATTLAKRCWSPAVAEMALALCLAALRRTSDFHGQMRVGKEPWVKSFPDDIDIHERELTGRSVGVVGFGAVGRRFVELLAPFKCQLGIHDPYAPAEAIAAAGATAMDIDTMVASCDVVICASSNKGTAHLIGAKQIRALRKHAVLVNVARSALIDMPALTKRLAKGDLIACLDVFDQEPLAKTAPIRKAPNTFLTPHRAGGLIVSVQRAFTMLTDDLEAHLAGKPLKYPLVPAMLPTLDG
jgi:D-3-phosphoglycerate dehydrogenase